MKKAFALILALVMTLTLVSCGKKEKTDAEYIEKNGKLVVGMTIYEPMNYFDNNGKLTGFDTEFAEAVCAKMGLEAEFVEINWDTKEVELNAKSIDCIWNGMTITEERAANMSISLPYVKNAQVIVVKADSTVASTADLVGKTVVAEVGSAGEAQIDGEDADANLAKAEYVGMTKQTDCLMEVLSGSADFAVLDAQLAKSYAGKGDYAELAIVDELSSDVEFYAIGFKKNSPLTAEVNKALEKLAENGTIAELAEKYDVANTAITDFSDQK